MMKIILLRHGEAEGNLKKILMGCREESFLTEKGKQQAEKVGKYLQENEKIDYIFSSPINRAKETSLIVKKYSKKTIIYFDSLKEIDWGSISGLPISKIPKEISESFHKNPFEYIHPNGESLEKLFFRIDRFLKNEIVKEKYENKTILLVTHDNVIKGIIASFENIGKKALQIKISNASISNYIIDNGKYICLQLNKIILK